MKFGGLLTKRWIPLVIAGVLGLGAVALMQQYIGGQRLSLRRQAQELQKLYKQQEEVVIASKDIEAGATLEVADLEQDIVPRRFKQPYSTSRVGDLIGQLAIAPIAKGEQVLRNKVRRPEDVPVGATLADVTPKGKRAITIGVDSLTGVGGFVRPGNDVDILWIVRAPQPGSEEAELINLTLLQDINVLAVGQKIVGKKHSGEDVEQDVDYTVTLALTPDETALILYAREQGKIQLSLRSNIEEEELVDVTPMTIDTLMETVLGQEVIEEAEPVTDYNVEVFKGLDRSVVAVSR